MNTRFRKTKGLFSSAFLLALIQTALVNVSEGSTRGRNRDVVPFSEGATTPIVRGTINGRSGNFVLDLSSPNSWLSADSGPRGETLKLNLNRTHKIQIGDRVFDLRFRQAHLPDNTTSDLKILGILGQDFFLQSLLTINYVQRTVQFHPKKASLESVNAAGVEIVPIKITQEGVQVPLLLNMKRRFESNYTLELAAQKSSLRSQDLAQMEASGVRVLGGGVVPDLSGDGTPEAAVEVEMAMMGISESTGQSKFRTLALKQKTGNIGVDYLARFRTTIDLKAGKIAIAPATTVCDNPPTKPIRPE